MVRRTKEESEQTRQALLDAAEHVFMDKGVAAASLEDIARHAGLTRGAIYWHFKNKSALFDAMHERVKLPMDEMLDRAIIDNDPLNALKDLCIFALQNMVREERVKRVYTILMFKCEQACTNVSNQTRQKRKREEIIGRSTKIFTSARNKNMLRNDISPNAAAITLHAYMAGIMADYLSYPSGYDLMSMAPVMLDVFFKGLRIENALT